LIGTGDILFVVIVICHGALMRVNNQLVSVMYVSVRFNVHQEYQNSFYRFENDDGTHYTVQTVPAEYGGIYVIVNENSLWRWHGNMDVKFLCGNDNDYTRRAVMQIMTYHDARMVQLGVES
jgi:hypothetical protein